MQRKYFCQNDKIQFIQRVKVQNLIDYIWSCLKGINDTLSFHLEWFGIENCCSDFCKTTSSANGRYDDLEKGQIAS